MTFSEHEWFMRIALEQAEHAANLGEVPVGAVVIDSKGAVLAKAYNLKETKNNPCSHAEIEAISAAAEKLGDWRLEGCALYVTLEPCAMCAGAIIHSRLKKVYFGAYDPKGGILSCGMNLWGNKHLNHKIEVVGGLLHFDCASQLSNFFRQRRKGHV